MFDLLSAWIWILTRRPEDLVDDARDSLAALVDVATATATRKLAAAIAPHLPLSQPSLDALRRVAREHLAIDESGYGVNVLTGERWPASTITESAWEASAAEGRRAMLAHAERIARALAAAWGVTLPEQREAWGEPDERDAEPAS